MAVCHSAKQHRTKPSVAKLGLLLLHRLRHLPLMLLLLLQLPLMLILE